MKKLTLAIIAAGALSFGASTAMAKGDCAKFEGYGYADNIGTGKDQASTRARSMAEVWARGYVLSKYKLEENDCKKKGAVVVCEADAKACRTPRTH